MLWLLCCTFLAGCDLIYDGISGHKASEYEEKALACLRVVESGISMDAADVCHEAAKLRYELSKRSLHRGLGLSPRVETST